MAAFPLCLADRKRPKAASATDGRPDVVVPASDGALPCTICHDAVEDPPIVDVGAPVAVVCGIGLMCETAPPPGIGGTGVIGNELPEVVPVAPGEKLVTELAITPGTATMPASD